MALRAPALLIALLGSAALPAMAQTPRNADCVEWHACRQLALAAAERGDYGTFHDLAWRAVQTGPPKDPSLMYLLARAQALSGRPHDALIMLQRLAEMGVPSDAATNEDFARVRDLPGWPALEARVGGAAAPAPAPAKASPIPSASATPPAAPPSPRVTPSPAPAPKAVPPPASPPPPSPPTPTPAAILSVLALAPATQAVRFSAKQFAISGLAYDAPSRRFVMGDRRGRKLIVVDEGSSHTMDLVRADSAEFLDISAVEIDAKRGDLWVASSAPADGAGTLHRLQMVSGRPLKAFPVGGDLGPVKLVDLAVGPSGAVLVLDAAAPQLLVLRAGGTAVERVVRLDATDPASVAARPDDGIAWVAHRDGLSRIDLRSRGVSRVAAPKGVSLDHLERIRWRHNALIAVQVDGDGSRRVLRLELNARGSAITQAIRLELASPTAGDTFVTIAGDELLYLRSTSSDADGRRSPNSRPDQAESEFVAYRAPLP